MKPEKIQSIATNLYNMITDKNYIDEAIQSQSIKYGDCKAAYTIYKRISKLDSRIFNIAQRQININEELESVVKFYNNIRTEQTTTVTILSIATIGNTTYTELKNTFIQVEWYKSKVQGIAIDNQNIINVAFNKDLDNIYYKH